MPLQVIITTAFIFTTAAQQPCCVGVVKIMENWAKYYFHNRKTTSQQSCCVTVVKIIFGPIFHYFHNRQYLAKLCFEK